MEFIMDLSGINIIFEHTVFFIDVGKLDHG